MTSELCCGVWSNTVTFCGRLSTHCLDHLHLIKNHWTGTEVALRRDICCKGIYYYAVCVSSGNASKLPALMKQIKVACTGYVMSVVVQEFTFFLYSSAKSVDMETQYI